MSHSAESFSASQAKTVSNYTFRDTALNVINVAGAGMELTGLATTSLESSKTVGIIIAAVGAVAWAGGAAGWKFFSKQIGKQEDYELEAIIEDSKQD